jgi:hypothetical protein
VRPVRPKKKRAKPGKAIQAKWLTPHEMATAMSRGLLNLGGGWLGGISTCPVSAKQAVRDEFVGNAAAYAEGHERGATHCPDAGQCA